MKITNKQIEFAANKPAQTTIYPYIGSILQWGGNNSSSIELTDYLLCDGRSCNIIEYQELFNVIGYTYGGSGASFNVPNLQERFPIGADNSSNLLYNNVVSGGVDTLEDEHYPHTHTLTFNETAFESRRGAETEGGNRDTTYSYAVSSLSIDISNNNYQTGPSAKYYPKYCIVNYIIRAK